MTSSPATLTPENNFPLNIQPTIMHSYSQNDYTYSLPSSISQLTHPPLNSYMYSTNLPTSFSSATPYYSSSIVQSNNCPPDQNPYPIAPYLVNSNPLVTSQTTSSTSINFDNRQEESQLYYYV
jgi:hypothetical protein